MNKKIRLLLLFALATTAFFVMKAESETRIINTGKVLFFVAKNPNPKAEGYVAYEIGKPHFEKLQDWGPDTNTNLPPLAITDAVSLARTEIEMKYGYKGERVVLREVVLLKAASATKNVWYYIVAHQVNTAKNPLLAEMNDSLEIRIPVLMDGHVVEPSHLDMSEQIRIHGSDVLIEPSDFTTKFE